MPARPTEQDAFFETLAARTSPQTIDWNVAKEGVNYADVPNFESYMPAYNESLDLLNTFGTKWQATPGPGSRHGDRGPQDPAPGDLGPGRLRDLRRRPQRRTPAPARRPTLLPSGLAWRRARWGYLFIAPWIIGFLAFTLFPMVATLAFTFTNINLAQEEPLQFVGLRNYQTLLGDKQAWDALGVTLKFALIALPVGVVLPFASRCCSTRATCAAGSCSGSCSSCPTSCHSWPAS